MFSPAPLMKLELPNVTIFGYISLDKFNATHVHSPEEDIVVELRNPGQPSPNVPVDLVLPVSLTIMQDGSATATGMGSVLFVANNIAEKLNFLNDITTLVVNRHVHKFTTHIMNDVDNQLYASMSNEERTTHIAELVDCEMSVSDKLHKIRNSNAVSEEAPASRPTVKVTPANEPEVVSPGPKESIIYDSATPESTEDEESIDSQD